MSEEFEETRPNLLRNLLAEYRRLRELGVPDALERLCADHPAQSAELREGIRQLEGAGDSEGAGKAAPTLGRFQVIRELGRGGMGVVWLVRDARLGREVALKTLVAKHLAGSQARRRFERETRSIAQLGHPAIVPVYEVGEIEGAPYFTTEYVAGRSLAEIVQALRSLARPPSRLTAEDLASAARLGTTAPAPADPTDPTAPPSGLKGYAAEAVRIVREVALALDHAHQRGVVHRDVKPSNVMLDADRRPRLLDFGIARLESDVALTRGDDPVGTPIYASPEQVRGGPGMDARTDIYSLGVTLYELLTLERPFTGSNTEQLFRRILTVEPAPPRRFNPAVPRDLENVCLKALEKEPSRRYPSAAALAADLQRVLDLHPVEARPIGPLTRGARWVRRHPAPASSIALALILLVGGPLSFALYQKRLNTLLEEEQGRTQAKAEEARRHGEEAKLQAVEADANFRLAYHAVQQLLARVSAQDLVAVPQTQKLRRDLMVQAARFFEKLLTARSHDAPVRLALALLQRNLGDLCREMGLGEKAGEAYESSRSLLEQLCRESPEGSRAHRELSALLVNFGQLLSDQGRWADSAESYRAALDLLSGIDEDPEVQAVVGQTLVNLGVVSMVRLRRPVEARGLLEEAIAACERVPAPTWEVQRSLGSARHQLGILLAESGEVHRAEELLRAAAGLRERLARGDQVLPTLRDEYAQTLRWQADVDRRLGHLAVAEERAERAVRRQDRLFAEFPEAVPYRFNLARCHHMRGMVQLARHRTREAERDLLRALELLAPLGGEDGEPFHLMRYAQAFSDLGVVYYWAGRHDEEIAQFEKALQIRRLLEQRTPDSAWTTFDSATVLGNLGRALFRLRRFEEAAQRFTEGMELLEEAARLDPDNARYAARLIRSRADVTTARWNLGVPASEAPLLDLADDELRALLERELPASPEVWGDVLDSTDSLIRRLRHAGGTDTAASLGEIVEGLYYRLEDAEVPVPAPGPFANVLDALGGCLKDLKRFSEARDAYQCALDLREQIALDAGDSAEALHWLGASHSNLASLLMWTEEYEEALDCARQAIEFQSQALELRPGHAQTLQFLRYHWEGCADALLGLGDHEEAAEAADELAACGGPAIAAGVLARCAGLAETGEFSHRSRSLHDAERDALVEDYTRRCLEALRQSLGTSDPRALPLDSPVFDSVRDSPDFQEIARQAAGPGAGGDR